MNTSLTGKETHGLDDCDVEDISSAAASASVPITSEDVARQIKAATVPLTKRPHGRASQGHVKA